MMSAMSAVAPWDLSETQRLIDNPAVRLLKSPNCPLTLTFLHRAFKQDGVLVAECRRNAFMRRRPVSGGRWAAARNGAAPPAIRPARQFNLLGGSSKAHSTAANRRATSP